MGYVLREGGAWSGDLLLADCEDLENVSASEIHVQKDSNTKKSRREGNLFVSMCGRENLQTL